MGVSKTRRPSRSPMARVQCARASGGWCRRDHEGPDLVGDPRQQVQDLGSAGGVEAGDGLVGQHQLGSLDQQPGDRDALALTAGETLGAFVDGPLEPDRLQRVEGPLVGARPGERGERASGAPLGQPTGVDVVQHPHLLDQVEALRDRADPPLEVAARAGGEAERGRAEELDGAFGRLQRTVQQPQQRALAGAAGTQDGDPLTRADREVDADEGRDAAEAASRPSQSYDDGPRPLVGVLMLRAHARRSSSSATARIWS